MSRGGRRWRIIRAAFRTHCEEAGFPCWLCGQPIDYQIATDQPDSWAPDHYLTVRDYPHLELDPANLRASHRLCNENRGSGSPTTLGVVSRHW